MTKFLSGPPGGRTLPQTPTRLSDLAGGVYGPGASVASTGINSHRPAIKAGLARAAGETWNDVLEYYQVRLSHSAILLKSNSSVQCRSWRNRFCVPSRQNILSGQYISLIGRHCVGKRRSRRRYSKLCYGTALFRDYRTSNLAN